MIYNVWMACFYDMVLVPIITYYLIYTGFVSSVQLKGVINNSYYLIRH